MDQITIETLYTTAGIVAIVMIVVQVLKVLVPVEFTVQTLRRIGLVLGTVLFLTVAIVSDGPEDGTNVALFWIVVAVNGLITGLAASGLFDTVKYGTDRVVESVSTEAG